ncbi:hypothetical protein [Campylobacter magnus]|uniref:hypothetical protein n=1 Tax=Campylobacter magnus TaxID=3026462 RepID=UPI00235E4FDB|nr:hypothetical protein [Campylobacter magnus]MDD0856023.1 hypothetical protein [Campylobacter magnus]
MRKERNWLFLAGGVCGVFALRGCGWLSLWAIFYAHSLRSPAAYAEASACFPSAYALKNCRRTSANATATPPHG